MSCGLNIQWLCLDNKNKKTDKHLAFRNYIGLIVNKSEFDKFAEEYKNILKDNIKCSGEDPEYFAEYKIKDVLLNATNKNFSGHLRILDFGSGVGNSVPYFNQYFTNSELTALDISEKSLAIAKERFPDQANYLPFDGEHIPLADNSFDIIFTACVFHHIPPENHSQTLLELKRVLKPGGFFIIFEHNPYNPLTNHAVNTCIFDENAILLTAKKFKKTLLECNFFIEKIAYRIFFPSLLKKLRFMEKWLTWLPLGAQYYIVVRK